MGAMSRALDPEPEASEAPEDAVFHLLRRVMQEHAALWTERIAAAGLPECTKPQYAVLRAVRAYPGIDQVAAGQYAASDKATVAALLARLEQRGLLSRDVDPGDRRRRLLRLTPEGESLLDRIRQVAEEVNEQLLRRLDEHERREFEVLVGKLATAEEAGQRQ